MVKNQLRWFRLLLPRIRIMIKATPELEAKIKASGIPIIEITLEEFQKAEIIKVKPNIYKQNNGNTSNR